MPAPASRRHAALIASAVTLPIVIVLALLFARSTDSTSRESSAPPVLSPVKVSAPPSSSATAGPCTSVLAALPVQLETLAPRAVDSSSPFAVAWGDPPVVLRCGVDKPAELAPLSDAFLVQVGGVVWFPEKKDTSTVFIAIDRAVYLEVTVPQKWVGIPLPALSAAIAKTLPAVCVAQTADGAVPRSSLCTYR